MTDLLVANVYFCFVCIKRNKWNGVYTQARRLVVDWGMLFSPRWTFTISFMRAGVYFLFNQGLEIESTRNFILMYVLTMRLVMLCMCKASCPRLTSCIVVIIAYVKSCLACSV